MHACLGFPRIVAALSASSMHCAILYKGLEHPQILVSVAVLEPVPCGYWGTAVLIFDLIPSKNICCLLQTKKDAELCSRYKKNTYNTKNLLIKESTCGWETRYFIRCRHRMNYMKRIILNVIQNHSSSNLLCPQVELFPLGWEKGGGNGGEGTDHQLDAATSHLWGMGHRCPFSR